MTILTGRALTKALESAIAEGITKLEDGYGPHADLHLALFAKAEKRSDMSVSYLDYFNLAPADDGYVEAVYRLVNGGTKRERIQI